MESISVKELVKSGAHFGHLTPKWHPKMKQYIHGVHNGTHILDLKQTLGGLKEAYKYAYGLGQKGDRVLYVGTKQIAREIISEKAQESGNFYITNRWLGGTLTNFSTVRQSILKLDQINNLAGEDITYPGLLKKEAVRHEKERQKLLNIFGGIRGMRKLPSALFVVDTSRERIAIKECRVLGIPIVALVDSNVNPEFVDFVIPGNDDSKKTVSLVTSVFTQGFMEGRKAYEDRKNMAKFEEQAEEKDILKDEASLEADISSDKKNNSKQKDNKEKILVKAAKDLKEALPSKTDVKAGVEIAKEEVAKLVGDTEAKVGTAKEEVAKLVGDTEAKVGTAKEEVAKLVGDTEAKVGTAKEEVAKLVGDTEAKVGTAKEEVAKLVGDTEAKVGTAKEEVAKLVGDTEAKVGTAKEEVAKLVGDTEIGDDTPKDSKRFKKSINKKQIK